MLERKLFFSMKMAQSMLLGVLLLAPFSVMANPKSGKVVEGKASISSSHNETKIVQKSDVAIISWKDFSIKKNETTTFFQPSSSSITLNRVAGEKLSDIQGALIANGKVFLTNPQGIVFGADCYLSTKGFLATTLNINSQDVLEHSDLLMTGESDAKIQNFGVIRSEESDIYLIAREVENYGHIEAKEGNVSLIGATEILMSQENDDVAIRMPTQGRVCNEGYIKAAQVELKAAGGNIYSLAVSNNGVIAAKGIKKIDDRIIVSSQEQTDDEPPLIIETVIEGKTVLEAKEGKTYHSGKIEVSSPEGMGGIVHLLGEEIELGVESKISASAPHGKGVILIGGDYKGKNAEIPNAKKVTVPFECHIFANATEKGDGGKVICWADDEIHMKGFIEARGSGKEHKGGFVEVSSHGIWEFDGHVDTQCLCGGKTGTLLFDPSDITIRTGSTTGMNGPVAAPASWTAAGATAYINNVALQGLLGANSIIIDSASAFGAAGNITVDAPLAWASGNSLELRAVGAININSTAPIGMGGNLYLNADNAGGGTNITIQAPITWADSSVLQVYAKEQINIEANITNTDAVGGPTTVIDVQAQNGNNPVVYFTGAAISTQVHGINILCQNGSSYAQGVTLEEDGSSVPSSIQTVSGAIAILGEIGTISFASDGRFGILIDDNCAIETQDGNVTLTGVNNVVFATAANQHGIGIKGTVTATGSLGTGTMTLTGTGSQVSGSKGIYMYGGSGVVTTSTHALSLTGMVNPVGSNTGTGIYLDDSQIVSNGAIPATAGTITLNGTVGGSTTSGSLNGVYGDDSLISTVQGAVTVTGTVNRDGGTPLEFTNNSQFLSTGTGASVGTVTLTGSGNKSKVQLQNTVIETIDADISLVTTVASTAEDGINLATSTVETTGTGANAGDISMTGLLGNVNGTGRSAIWVQAGSTVTTADGSITLNGTNNNASGSAQYGVQIQGTVSSTGPNNLGTLSITGVGPDLANSRGVRIADGAGIVSSVTNNISITGTNNGAGTTADLRGILVSGGAQVNSTGTSAASAATITLNGTVSGTSSSGDQLGLDMNVASISTVQGAVNLNGINNLSNPGSCLQLSGTSITSTGLGSSVGTISLQSSGGISIITLTGGSSITSVDADISLVNGTSVGPYKGIDIRSSSTVQTTGTGSNGGDITITGLYGTLAAATRHAVWVRSGSTVTTDDGNINITGTNTVSGSTLSGVKIEATVSSTGTGNTGNTLTITGTAPSANTSYGVHISGASAVVSSAMNDISITGTATGAAAVTPIGGILVDSSSSISSTGSSAASAATITLNGSCLGTSSGASQFGVELQSSTITSDEGTVSVTGQTASPNSSSNAGIRFNNSSISTTGTAGTITLNSTGSGVNNNYGVNLLGSSFLTSADASIGVTSTNGAAGTSNSGIRLENTSYIRPTGTGGITLNGTGSGSGTSTGVYLLDSAYVQAAAGGVAVTGSSSSSGNGNVGIQMDNTSYAKTTDTGAITFNGTGSGANNSYGVHLLTSAYIESFNGDTFITGSTPATGTGNGGVRLENASYIKPAGTGQVTINGSSAGSGTARGIHLLNTSYIESSSGATGMTGTTTATGNSNIGIRLEGSSYVKQTGAGTLIVNGTGSGTDTSHGVNLAGTSYIESTDGAVSVTGSSNATGNTNKGIFVEGASARITATGATTITIDGTGAGGAPAPSGVEVNGRIESISGTINITATPGAGSNDGLVISSTGIIGGASTTGDIKITAPSVDLNSGGSSTTLRSTGNLFFTPSTVGSSIGIGNGSAGTFNLNNNEANNIAAGFTLVRIGIPTTGTHAVDITSTPTFLSPVEVRSNTISVAAAANLTGTDVTLYVGQTVPGTFSMALTGFVSASGTFQVLGGSFDDAFTVLDPNQVIDLLDGGASTPASENTLTGTNSPQNWSITGLNQGFTSQVVTTPLITFQNIQNIKGGSDDDVFLLTVQAAALSGTTGIDGTTSAIVGNYLYSPTGVSTNYAVNTNNTGVVTPSGGTATNYQNVQILNGSTTVMDYLDYSSNPADPLTVDFLNYQATDVNAVGAGATGAPNSFANIEGVVINNATVVNLTGNPAISTELALSSGNNIWTITGIDQGNVVTPALPRTVNFTNFANLRGGTGDDDFVIQDGQGLTGSIDGGEPGGQNKLDYTAFSTPVTIDLVAGTATNIAGGISNIVDTDIGQGTIIGGVVDDIFYVKVGGATFVDGEAGTNTLIGPLSTNTWTIDGSQTVPASGNINGTVNVDFDRCQRLVGGGVADTFIMIAAGVVDYIDGGSSSDTLIAKNQDNTWQITDDNAGSVPTVGSFVSIENLTGGTQADRFVLADGKGVAGIVDGGSDSGNVLDYSNYTSFITIDYANQTATNIGGFRRIQEIIYPNGQVQHERGFFSTQMITTLLYDQYDHMGNITFYRNLRMKAFNPYEGFYWLKENDLMADEEKQEEIWK